MRSDEGDLTFVETTPADDVIEGRAPLPPVRWARGRPWLAVIVLAVLAAGIGIGYTLGRHTSKAASGEPAPAPAPAGSVLTELPRLHTTGSVCSAQPSGANQLMLGVEVQNSGTAPIELRAVRGSFPLGLLRTDSAAVGACDNPGIPVLGSWVAAGASTWLRLTVDVLAHCPTWAPVEFQVDYKVNGALTSMSLAGFPDLGGVAYSGC
jgi:hypothetical protein